MVEIVVHGVPGSGKTSVITSLIGRIDFIYVPELWRFFPPEDLRGDFWSVIQKDILREFYIEQIRKNNLVIAERNHISTLAYRYAKGIYLEKEFEKLKKYFSIPELYVLLKIDSRKAVERMGRRKYPLFEDGEHTVEFFDSFYKACIYFIEMEGVEYKVIDANRPLDQVVEDFLEVVKDVGGV